jgi:hypothetical protein
MRITTLLVICMFCLIAAPAVWGQAPDTSAKPGILGYLDPHTGAFRPVPPPTSEDIEAAAVTTVGGTISVTITITLKTTGLTNITCTANTMVLDNITSPVSYEESNIVAATGSGVTRTCKLTIPYSWALATQSSDNMSTSYTVFGSTGTTGLPQRSATRSPLDTRKVPSNGTTTTLTAAVTL